MSIEFPLTPFRSKYGVMHRPLIPVVLKIGSRQKEFKFILDSGAEFTMAPKRMAPGRNIDMEEFSSITVEGIEGGGLRGVLAPLSIQIGKEKLTVRCFFAVRDDAPLLLGRADFFDRFNILFDARKKKVVLTRI